MRRSIEMDITPKGEKLAKSLQLEGGVFIDRHGAIDSGWKIMAEGQDEQDRDIVVIGKDEDGVPKTRHVSPAELVRLNTGRNRGALEYLDRIKAFASRSDLRGKINRADDDPGALKELRAFFEKEALKLGNALRPPVRARNVEDLAEKLAAGLEHRLGIVEAILSEHPARLVALRSEIGKTKDRDRLRELREDEEEGSLQLIRAKGDKRRIEHDWDAEVEDILKLINLAQQFSK